MLVRTGFLQNFPKKPTFSPFFPEIPDHFLADLAKVPCQQRQFGVPGGWPDRGSRGGSESAKSDHFCIGFAQVYRKFERLILSKNDQKTAYFSFFGKNGQKTVILAKNGQNGAPRGGSPARNPRTAKGQKAPKAAFAGPGRPRPGRRPLFAELLELAAFWPKWPKSSLFGHFGHFSAKMAPRPDPSRPVPTRPGPNPARPGPTRPVPTRTVPARPGPARTGPVQAPSGRH